MRVLLVSTYALGHQPLQLASPAAALQAAGHAVRCLDLAVEDWDEARVAWADAVALSLPMHTATRLAVRAVHRMRERNRELPICLYGLYAPVGAAALDGEPCAVIAGEYEPELVAWADRLEHGEPAASAAPAAAVHLPRGRGHFAVPDRRLLPPLERYAHLEIDGERRPVGAVETTHGCAHRCRHCPIPAVYDGAFRVVDADVVLADIARLVEQGARHITFDDPDFLNGPAHARRIVDRLRREFPGLTFDCTVKVEHILRHADLWEQLAAAGCLFVVSALETCNDEILALLDKGHTAADAGAAVHLLRRHGIDLRPSFLPFTPWTRIDDVAEILRFVVAHELVGSVDPVQYTIRLLIPEGSLLLDRPELWPHLGPYDPERLTYTWQAADPAVDALQRELAALVEQEVAAAAPIGETFGRVVETVSRAAADAGLAGIDDAAALPAGAIEGRPRLSEPWFC